MLSGPHPVLGEPVSSVAAVLTDCISPRSRAHTELHRVFSGSAMHGGLVTRRHVVPDV